MVGSYHHSGVSKSHGLELLLIHNNAVAGGNHHLPFHFLVVAGKPCEDIGCLGFHHQLFLEVDQVGNHYGEEPNPPIAYELVED